MLEGVHANIIIMGSCFREVSDRDVGQSGSGMEPPAGTLSEEETFASCKGGGGTLSHLDNDDDCHLVIIISILSTGEPPV